MSAIIAAASVRALGSELIALDAAAGRMAFEDIASPSDLPAFDRSAVDGYGIHRDDLHSDHVDLALAARLPAGRDAAGIEIARGETIWLATGAAIPSASNTAPSTAQESEIIWSTYVPPGGLRLGHRTGVKCPAHLHSLLAEVDFTGLAFPESELTRIGMKPICAHSPIGRAHATD